MTKYNEKTMIRSAEGRAPEMLIDTTRGKDMKRGFTLIIGFSRPWCVKNFWAAFNRLRIDMKNCHLLVIDNSNWPDLAVALKQRINTFKHAFHTVRLYKTWRLGGDELKFSFDLEWERSKIPYIFALQLDEMRLCTTDKFVVLEDDTLPPYKTRPDVVMYMLDQLKKNKKCGVYSAIETGRCGTPYLKVQLGVHYLKREGNKLLWRLTPGPNLRGIHKMDSCGWYCCASYKNLWTKALKEMSDYVADIPRFALDVIHTNNIKRMGYDILADFSLWCIHMNSTSEKILFWGKKQAVPMLDAWLPEWNEYAIGIRLSAEKHQKMIRRLVWSRDRS